MQKGILSLIITALFLFLFASLSEQNYVKIYSQESEKQQNQELSNSPIVLTAKLIDNQYRWIGSNNAINPTLNITSGIENQIAIKSMEGDKVEHELVIEGISAGGDSKEKGKKLAKSDEIEDGSSTTVNFNPSDKKNSDYQSLEYYCEYHPDTMRGKIQIK